MYYYKISVVDFDEHEEFIIYHDVKFNPEDFTKMYNEAVEDSNGQNFEYVETQRHYVVEYLVEIYKFKKIEFFQFEFRHSESGTRFKKLDSIDKINKDSGLCFIDWN